MRASRFLIGMATAGFTQLPAVAQAQETSGLGSERPLVVSLEHVGGVVATRSKAEGADEATTIVSAGTFLGSFLGMLPMARLGVHYFVAPPVSVGALLSYSDNDAFGETVLFGARVGAAFPLGASTDLWLRGGVHYFRSEVSLLGKTTLSDVRPGGEALFAFTAAENFGFLLGGMFEIGVAGKQETESRIPGQTSERDFDYMEYGLTCGAFVNF
ncbi:MAG: hypothetical protein R3B13_02785 [Polyangiaceae bacterium]